MAKVALKTHDLTAEMCTRCMRFVARCSGLSDTNLMETPRVLTRGDVIRIRPVPVVRHGRRVPESADWTIGRVIIASSNGASVAVEISDFLRDGRGGLYAAGTLVPLIIDYEAETVTDLMGSEYEIDVAG